MTYVLPKVQVQASFLNLSQVAKVKTKSFCHLKKKQGEKNTTQMTKEMFTMEPVL